MSQNPDKDKVFDLLNQIASGLADLKTSFDKKGDSPDLEKRLKTLEEMFGKIQPPKNDENKSTSIFGDWFE